MPADHEIRQELSLCYPVPSAGATARARRATTAVTTSRSALPRRRRLAALAVVAAAALGVGGLALADAFGPLHGAKLVLSPTTVGGTIGDVATCTLIGQRAELVASELQRSGIVVEWRFMHWGGTTVTTGGNVGAVTGGYTGTPASVPGDSIVWDVSPDDRTPGHAFVFVEAPNDPNAPTIVPPDCGR